MKVNDTDASQATLRDLFAASAMQALLSDNVGMTLVKESGVDPIISTAADAYLFADAMLAERLK
jgi:hypothetical protein